MPRRRVGVRRGVRTQCRRRGPVPRPSSASSARSRSRRARRSTSTSACGRSLRAIAAGKLLRRGVDLERRPDRARELLGPIRLGARAPRTGPHRTTVPRRGCRSPRSSASSTTWSGSSGAERARRARERSARRGRARRRRQARPARARPRGAPRRRPRAARGRPRSRQDAHRALVRRRSPGSRFARVQFTPDLLPATSPASSICEPARRGVRVPARARCSPTSCSPTRSTAPRRRRRPRCSRRCRSARSRSTATTHAARAAVPRPRDAEPDRVRGHVPAARGAARPLPAAHRASATRGATTSGRCSSAGSSGAPTRSSCRAVVDRPTAARDAARGRDVHVDESVGRYVVDLVAATRESPSVAVGASPRGSLALLKLSRVPRGARGPRLRDARRREARRACPALAHRLVLRPELWVQRRAARTSCARSSTRSGRRRPSAL